MLYNYISYPTSLVRGYPRAAVRAAEHAWGRNIALALFRESAFRPRASSSPCCPRPSQQGYFAERSFQKIILQRQLSDLGGERFEFDGRVAAAQFLNERSSQTPNSPQLDN